MPPRLATTLAIALATAPLLGRAEPLSTVALPMDIALGDLAALLDSQIPADLHRAGPARHICVPAQRACFDIPEFRGLKIYRKRECIDITPEISCDIAEHVYREGPIQVSGEGGTLKLRQIVVATANVRGRGDIGRNISETAHARADVSVSVTPRVAPDWTLGADVAVTYRWIDRPTVRLFNLFDIIFAGKVEPEMDRAIAGFRDQMTQELARLNLPRVAEEAWIALHEPLEIPLPGDTRQLYLNFRPAAVGFSGLDVAGGRLRATVSISGYAHVGTHRAKLEPSPLPHLSAIPTEASGFAVDLPLTLSIEALNAQLLSALPNEVKLNGSASGAQGTIRVISAELTATGSRLAVRMQVANRISGLPAALRMAGLGNYTGTVTFSATPVYDQESKLLRLADARLTLDSTSPFARLIGLASQTGLMARLLDSTFVFDLSENIAELDTIFAAVLNRSLGNGLELRGSGTFGFADLAVQGDAIVLRFTSRGEAMVTGVALR